MPENRLFGIFEALETLKLRNINLQVNILALCPLCPLCPRGAESASDASDDCLYFGEGSGHLLGVDLDAQLTCDLGG